ncbi:metal-dependent hydrolase [Methanobacterium spitsbergense]|uniref:Metal-dependent hydrolase n=1 Tax=Methanobacterium spitsbergense TaxID=2874285 RepID=A0A8T5UTD2_9EURY|nr:metal-dependent hydrolase [Methanobacterium spitsbergense]MBZ2164470.1 metal-dependent hydrolase [Methanobacterium spitsbergense]
MRSYTHITGAILLFISFAYLTNLNYLWVGILFAGWISVFPDILDRFTGTHRGYGHSIFWIIPCLFVGFWSITIAAALVTGLISHVILDILTTKGSPILYPLSKTNFVVLKENRRIKTGTNQDKALFLVLIFLLIPVLFFTIQSICIDKTSFDLSHAFATNGTNGTNTAMSNPQYSMKNNPNLNIQLPKPVKNVNETITIKKVDENETRIMVNNT